MTYIYQITDWKKNFYILSRNENSDRVLSIYENKYNNYIKKERKNKHIAVFDIFDGNEDYCILLMWSCPDNYRYIFGGHVMKKMISSDLKSINVF